MPQGGNVNGPVQVANQIQSDQTISAQFTLLSQGGSNVKRGQIQLIPVGTSIVYVQPIYVQQSGNQGYPRLQFVVVFTQGREPGHGADRERGHRRRSSTSRRRRRRRRPRADDTVDHGAGRHHAVDHRAVGQPDRGVAAPAGPGEVQRRPDRADGRRTSGPTSRTSRTPRPSSPRPSSSSTPGPGRHSASTTSTVPSAALRGK